jgi:hypothetical protein
MTVLGGGLLAFGSGQVVFELLHVGGRQSGRVALVDHQAINSHHDIRSIRYYAGSVLLIRPIPLGEHSLQWARPLNSTCISLVPFARWRLFRIYLYPIRLILLRVEQHSL